MFIDIKINVVLFVNEAASPLVQEWAFVKASRLPLRRHYSVICVADKKP